MSFIHLTNINVCSVRPRLHYSHGAQLFNELFSNKAEKTGQTGTILSLKYAYADTICTVISCGPCVCVILLSIFDLIKRLRFADLHWFFISELWMKTMMTRWWEQQQQKQQLHQHYIINRNHKICGKECHPIEWPWDCNAAKCKSLYITLTDIDGNSHDAYACMVFFLFFLFIHMLVTMLNVVRARVRAHHITLTQAFSITIWELDNK